MDEQKIRAAEDGYMKMALTLAMTMNQLAVAHAALTRLPAALAKMLPEYRATIVAMREATLERKTQEERDAANRALDLTSDILDAMEKLNVEPEAIQSLTNILDVQKKQIEEMVHDEKTNAPGVQ